MSTPTEYYLDQNGLVMVLTALKSALVEKENGKGLSTEDFTAALKSKLEGIAAGAEVNVQPDWAQTDNTADDYIKNKPTEYTLPVASASTLGGIKVGNNLSIDANGVLSATGSGTIPAEYITETELAAYGYQTSAQVQSTVESYGYQTAAQVSSAISSAVASAYIYKGSVATVASLPSSGNTTGDVYNVEADGMNYAWNGTTWDALGATIDTSVFLTASDIEPISNANIQAALTTAGF